MTRVKSETGAIYSPAKQKYVIGVLLLMYIFAYMDRNVLALMVDDIKHSLHISDVQFSLVQGASFGAFYAIFGLPMGYIVDRFSKRWVLFYGISFWSVATVACGLSRIFPLLAISRFGVGAGEATLVPAAYSTIARILPKDRTATGIAIFSMGSSIGSGVAIGIGGYLIALLTKIGGITVPLLGYLAPWQAVFVLIGLPGLLIALLAFTLPETDSPVARNLTGATRVATPLLPFLIANRGYLLLTIGGLASSTVVAYGVAAWMPALLLRRYHADVQWVGMVMSGVILTGIIGFVLSGYLADRAHRAGRGDAHILPILYGLPFVIVASIVAFHFSTNVWLTLACFVLIHVLITMGNPVAAHIQLSTPPELRGRLAAITVAAQHLCGLSFGPLFVAIITDKVFHDPARVGDSMAIVATVVGFLGIILYGLACKPARAAVLRGEAFEFRSPIRVRG